jgi:excinuclease ABC subunit A
LCGCGVNGKLYDLDDFPAIAKNQRHTIDIVIDRMKVNAEHRTRLVESLESACRHGEGRVMVQDIDQDKEVLFSEHHACPHCSFAVAEMEPSLFSFNSPMGACPKCDGLGVTQFFDPARVITHRELSLEGGAIKGWDKRNFWTFSIIESVAKHYQFSTLEPWKDLNEQAKKVILYGSGTEKIQFNYQDGKQQRSVVKPFEGVIPNFERRYHESESPAMREELSRMIATTVCPDCHGARLKPAAAHVKVADTTLPTIAEWSLGKALDFFYHH